jgi:hypothetical protein
VADFYKLEGKTVTSVSLEEHRQWLATDPDQGRKVVARNEFNELDILVSTVFILGINHAFGSDKTSFI